MPPKCKAPEFEGPTVPTRKSGEQKSAAKQETIRPAERVQPEDEIPASTPDSGGSVARNPSTPDHPIVSKCFRISAVPITWDRDDLLESLRELSLLFEELDSGDQLSLYPDCFDSNSKQTALLNFKRCPAPFLQLPLNDTSGFPVSDKKSGEVVDLLINSHFYNLTPLNVPGEEVVADVDYSIITVTGLAGHAYGSWRDRGSGRMWLQEFLPQDVKHVRIMTYGYNTSLIGRTVDDTLLDYRRQLVAQLENTRGSSEALAQSKSKQSQRQLLDLTRAIFFFGTPHRGLQTTEIETMVEDMTRDPESSRIQLLKQLRGNSGFLETLKEEISDIWTSERQTIRFYETMKTAAVAKSASEEYGRSGPEKKMVTSDSALLYLPNETRIPVKKTILIWLNSLQKNEKEAIENTRSKDMLAWLESLKMMDHQDYRDELLRKRHQDMFNWLQEDEPYQRLLKSNASTLLWINGAPGCGKSILIISVRESC
ncbi:hypothetical protein BDD12DRAFT_982249 [Trichophaea hybrida]|nr:hypothetical protein BDD12DRAFT_982249 [Trichophaea hybrida]